jgi:hypothetical protein
MFQYRVIRGSLSAAGYCSVVGGDPQLSPVFQPPPHRLHSRAEVATALGVSERTLRRLLPELMAANPSLKITRVGRTVLFTDEQFSNLLRAAEWRCISESVGKSGTREARCVSGGRSSMSRNSAQDRVRELTQRLRPRQKKRASAPTSLTVLRGGRAG